MSRCAARLNDTSSPSSRMRPEVGNSSPAIIRSVVVLPQPEGPSRQKNSPSSTMKLEFCTATNSPNALCRFSISMHAIASSLRKFGDDDEQHGPKEDRGEGIAVQAQPERLAQHDDARANDRRWGVLPRSAAKQSPTRRRARDGGHRRTAPKVMPRNRCLRNSTVNSAI